MCTGRHGPGRARWEQLQPVVRWIGRRSSGWKNREMERAAFLAGFDLGWRHCKGAPDHRKFEEDEK